MSVKGFEILIPKNALREWVIVTWAQARIQVRKQIPLAWSSSSVKLCTSITSLWVFFLAFVLMDPLFHVKVSRALVLSCVTFTVLFVPLAK